VDLAAELPRLFPLAVAWAEEQSTRILTAGEPLSDSAFVLARLVGVREPARVRLLVVPEVPAPTDPLLRAACAELKFLDAGTLGLTLGSGIFVKKGLQSDRRLVAHELRHVAQYEQVGSIEAYLAIYVPDLIRFGPTAAPLEIDAKRAAASCV
jgi:hypothetical protein